MIPDLRTYNSDGDTVYVGCGAFDPVRILVLVDREGKADYISVIGNGSGVLAGWSV